MGGFVVRGVPHVQKGAALIVNDQKAASLIATSFLTLSLLLVQTSAVLAADSASPVPATSSDQATSATVTVLDDGAESTFSTHGRTVADVLDERGIRVASDDYLSPAADVPVVDGMHVTVRSAQAVELRVGDTTRVVRTPAATVGDFLRSQGIGVGKYDELTPAKSSAIAANQTISLVRVHEWTGRERRKIAPAIVQRVDSSLALGKTKTIAAGAPGIRETTIRYVSRDESEPTATVVATRVVRAPHAKIVVRGLASSLARVAAQGFASAVHMAGSALHMIATAYTAGCYGCSGITASGVRAGFGVIAVDPSVIPLGTKVFIPGYGRAVAGDTGGAIQGHRVDLGFNSQSAAMQFGRRPVMLYILR
jgi:uncharacterized protein YabE (DUF348 family)